VRPVDHQKHSTKQQQQATANNIKIKDETTPMTINNVFLLF
jgi:hypothetical protein